MTAAMGGAAPGAEAGDDRADAGRGADDPGRVSVGVQAGDPLVEAGHLDGEDLGLFGFDGDVGGQFGVVHAVGAPQLEGLLGGGHQLGGLLLAPVAAGVASQKLGQTWLCEPDHGSP